MKRLLFHAILLAIALVVALVVSSSGVLVYSTTADKTAAASATADLKCTYFTGTGFIERRQKAPAKGAKKPSCAGVIKIRE